MCLQMESLLDNGLKHRSIHHLAARRALSHALDGVAVGIEPGRAAFHFESKAAEIPWIVRVRCAVAHHRLYDESARRHATQEESIRRRRARHVPAPSTTLTGRCRG